MFPPFLAFNFDLNECKVGMGISKMIFMNFYNYGIKGISGGLV